MRYVLLALSLLLLTSPVFAEEVIPSGTILPLQLNSSLNSKNVRPGQKISARLMQDVPLPSGSKLRAGSRVLGKVLNVQRPGPNGGAKLTLQFDSIEVAKHSLPLKTNLRALASMMEVNQAQIPQSGPDRGTSENSWTTEQIGGGDVVYRGGGPVMNASQVVGKPVPGGVLVQAFSSRTGCGDGESLQALWVFSSNACGTYGFDDLAILHSGRRDPVGTIVLGSQKGEIEIRGGSGLLLRVR